MIDRDRDRSHAIGTWVEISRHWFAGRTPLPSNRSNAGAFYALDEIFCQRLTSFACVACARAQAREAFKLKLEYLNTARVCRHPNVVRLIGVCEQDEHLYIVLEKAECR